MKFKIWWVAMVAAIVASFFVVPLAHAQSTDTDIANLRPTFQSLVDTLTNGIATGNAAQERSAAQAGIATANSLLSSLSNIQANAATDATRSRAAGLSDHLKAVVSSLQDAISGTDDAVAGKLNQALAEAQEALNEVPVSQLPQTGIGAEVSLGMLVVLGGFVLLGAGFGLRRLAVRA